MTNSNLKISRVTIGCDPEIFLADSKGVPQSAIDIVPGNKQIPYPIDNAGHFIQTDNVAVEYNIPPCRTKEEFIKENQFMLRFIQEFVAEKKLSLLITPSEEFSEEQLDHPLAQEFGCSTDNNIWTEKENEKPKAEKINFRSCGGHIAIGYRNPVLEISTQLGRAFDMFVTLPSLLIDNNEKAIKRRKLYGKVGASRFPKFGLEMRTLSNFWLKDEKLMGWVYDQTMQAIDYVNNANFHLSKSTGLGKRVYEAINNNDLQQAEKIIKELKIISMPNYITEKV